MSAINNILNISVVCAAIISLLRDSEERGFNE